MYAVDNVAQQFRRELCLVCFPHDKQVPSGPCKGHVQHIEVVNKVIDMLSLVVVAED